MTDRWEAPAKVNLSLEVRPPDAGGLHPLRSFVQTIEWCDHLDVAGADEDQLEISGADLPPGGANLVWKAVTALRQAHPGLDRPRLHMHLHKAIPVAAGLGGGSADAAAALLALADLRRVDRSTVESVAASVGADVPFLLTGGSALMEGYGERLGPARLALSYALGVIVPDFRLATGDVYQKWDRLEYPQGPSLSGRSLPPSLRELGALRNDLYPAAVALRPELADWSSELARAWERPVAMTGSGPALFGFFADLDEAEQAVRSAPGRPRSLRAALPRSRGASRAETS